MEKAEIKYPCRWTYRVIGIDENQLQNVVKECLKGQEYDLTAGNKSSKGRYVSLNLELEVQSQEHRDTIFMYLKEDPAIKMII